MSARHRLQKEPSRSASADVIALPLATDAALLQAVHAGRQRAVTALYERYEPIVRRVLFRVLGPDHEMSDITHDVFVALLESIHRVRDPAALRGFVTTTAVYTARSHIRRRSRWRPFIRYVPDIPETPSDSPDGAVSDAMQATYRVLNQLGANDRIVFSLRFIDGMELNDVATACDVSLATVKRRLLRASRRFYSHAKHEEALSDWLDEGGSCKK